MVNNTDHFSVSQRCDFNATVFEKLTLHKNYLMTNETHPVIGNNIIRVTESEIQLHLMMSYLARLSLKRANKDSVTSDIHYTY